MSREPAAARSNSATPRMWAWPIVLGLLSATGLVAALVSDGWGDAWSWLALGAPVAVIGWFGFRPGARTDS
jgi:hypothetical protein